MHILKHGLLAITLIPLLAGVPIMAAQQPEKGTNMTATTTTTTDIMTGVRRIIFVGDSLTDGSAWADWVIETLKAHGYPHLVMHNAGVAGNTVAQVKARLSGDVLSLKPNLVILNIGTNDSLRKVALDDYRRDLTDVVQQIRRQGARVLLMTPPALRDPERRKQQLPMDDIVRETAQACGCTFLDMHAAFVQGEAAGKELWGPDGVHHKLDGWRTLGRCTLAALGCTAPMIEETPLYPHALTDWRISPPMPWKEGQPYPPLPELSAMTDWRKFDRAAEMQQTSWWQVCWLARGGIMPLGQQVVPASPGAADRKNGAFALATVKVDKDTLTTIHLGGSPPYAVWLNGELLWDGKSLHGYHPDADRLPITLKKGENHILVFTNWLFYVSIGEI